eukprot:539040-Prorocentrum_minimum.AAC.1
MQIFIALLPLPLPLVACVGQTLNIYRGDVTLGNVRGGSPPSRVSYCRVLGPEIRPGVGEN